MITDTELYWLARKGYHSDTALAAASGVCRITLHTLKMGQIKRISDGSRMKLAKTALIQFQLN